MKFFDETPFAVTICDKDGNILEANKKSKETFAKYGELIGKSLFDCHHGQSLEKLNNLLKNHNVNVYTIEKSGLHKMIYQAPWFENGKFGGYIELSLILPNEIPHYIRK